MSKFLCACLVLLCVSCKKTDQPTTEQSDAAPKSQIITEKDISKLSYLDFGLDDRVLPIIESWDEFNQLQDIIENIKKGDLSYFKIDAKKNLNTLVSDINNTIPEALNTPSIQARILVVETKLYKTESLSNLSSIKKQELLEALKELLESYSNLCFQMNKKLENDSQSIERPM
jgi:hypothetical protein